MMKQEIERNRCRQKFRNQPYGGTVEEMNFLNIGA